MRSEKQEVLKWKKKKVQESKCEENLYWETTSQKALTWYIYIFHNVLNVYKNKYHQTE